MHLYRSSCKFSFSTFFVFCVSVKVKLTVPLLCFCIHSAWKGRIQNDLYCVRQIVNPYSLSHSTCSQFCGVKRVHFVVALYFKLETCQPSVDILCSHPLDF